MAKILPKPIPKPIPVPYPKPRVPGDAGWSGSGPTIYDNSVFAVDDYALDNPAPFFATECDVCWGTLEPSTSQVVYGKTTDYGLATTRNETLVRNHSVALTSLDPASTYHYKVLSRNSSGEETISEDHTFTTEQIAAVTPWDHYIRLWGPSQIYQGSTGYFCFQTYLLSWTTPSPSNVDTCFTVDGLASGMSAYFIATYLHSSIRDWDPYGRAHCYGFPKPPATIIRHPLAVYVSSSVTSGTYSFNLNVLAIDRTTHADIHSETRPITISVLPSATPYTPPALGTQPALPSVTEWKNRMDWGRDPQGHDTYLPGGIDGFFCSDGLLYYSGDVEMGAWYYDGMKVALQIRDFIGPSGATDTYSYWDQGISNVYSYYYPWVVNSQLGNGWRHFTSGSKLAYLSSSVTDYKLLVYNLYSNSGTSSIGSYAIGHPHGTLASVGDVVRPPYGRECAYAINAAVDSYVLGYSIDSTRLNAYVDCLLGMIDQWFVGRTIPYFQPFMVGLMSEALINYHDNYCASDYRILPKLQTAAAYLWNNAWHSPSETFFYDSKRWIDYDYPCILNLLIVDLYGWLYKQTGDINYRTCGDAIWEGGVNHGAQAWNGKQFCQNYKASFSYYNLRTS